MKISNSKQELARIISENGGWRDGAEWATQDCVVAFFSGGKPKYESYDKTWCANCDDGAFIVAMSVNGKINGFHNTILSRAEYFHLYPAPDAKPEFCESVMRSIPAPESKPTIEQLAADYRNAKDYADRKQQEADVARADAGAKLVELVAAGKAIGLVLGVEPVEPELVITDWRDLLVGDIVWVDAYDDHDEGEWPVNQMEHSSYDYDYAFSVKNGESCERWVDATKPWRFIRRP